MKAVAVVLAAGAGRRMKTDIKKQYLLLNDRPVLFYSLKEFENHEKIDEIVLVVGKGEIDYCQKEIIDRYDFHKVVRIVEGGQERYDSVYAGIKAVCQCDYLFIHDGARPFLDRNIIERTLETVKIFKACVAAVPVKDTIKIVDSEGFSKVTPDRSTMWMMQTPQVFEFSMIKKAYEKLMEGEKSGITDDAMVLERFMGGKIKMVEGSYRNIKITTPDDLIIGEALLKSTASSGENSKK